MGGLMSDQCSGMSRLSDNGTNIGIEPGSLLPIDATDAVLWLLFEIPIT